MAKGELTNKQERFCLNLFQGMSQREAYIRAGYSSKMKLTVIDVEACKLAENPNILLRLQELQKAAEDASIMNVVERKQTLTKQARGELQDVEVTRTMVGEVQQVEVQRVRVFNPTQAIAELNKMERIGAHESEVNISFIIQKIMNKLEVHNMDLSKLTDDELDLLESQLG